MRIRWTPPAAADMQSISDYLKEHHAHYRQPTLQKLYQGIRALKDAPYRGRPGRVEGTRELLFAPMPYVVVYSVRVRSAGAARLDRPRKTMACPTAGMATVARCGRRVCGHPSGVARVQCNIRGRKSSYK